MCKKRISGILALIISITLLGGGYQKNITALEHVSIPEIVEVKQPNVMMLDNKTRINQMISEILTESYSNVDEEVKKQVTDYAMEFINAQQIMINSTIYPLYKELTSSNIEMKLQEAQRKQEEEAAKVLAYQKEQARIENVKFNSWDLTDVSGITYEEMYNVLAQKKPYSNFVELASAFVDAERTYGVNAFALAAIPGLESGWNTSNRARNGSNNITGMAVYSDSSVGSAYKSKYDCIMDLAKQLKTHYLTPSGEYFNGTSTSKVNIKYCTSSDWYRKVDALGDELMSIYTSLYK